MTAWLIAFALTQALEAPIYVAALRGRPWARRILLALVPSAVTHPVVWFVFPALIEPYWTMVVVAEAFAVVVEAALLAGVMGVRRGWLWSLGANAFSCGTGFALFGLGVL